ncbi:hypothetical protein AB0H83_29820 [Dactylosporangium sp. NPDC050688]|uniref:hypothetical protein n=1 Tax=Dactylosporangium sp. NPDC050688 TaxID=3157217 RepID=UPI0033F77A20
MSRQIGPTAYVDEAYIQQPGHPGVYLLAAVLVESDEIDAIGEAARVAARGEPFHATQLHHRGHARQIEDMLDVVSQYASWSIVVAHTPISQGNELARQTAMQRLLRELHGSRVSDVILDVRGNPVEWDAAAAKGLPMPEINYRDRDTYRSLAAGKQISHRMRLIHRDDRLEPGLWLADVVAWSARRTLAADEPQWFNRVVDATTVYEAATGQLLVLNSEGAAPPDGDRGSHRQAQRGPETAAQPMFPLPYPGADAGGQYPRMGTFMTSVHVQAQQARHPAGAAPSDVAARLLRQNEQIAADIAEIRRALATPPATSPVPGPPPALSTDRTDAAIDTPNIITAPPVAELD